jgi:hypothetical protein
MVNPTYKHILNKFNYVSILSFQFTVLFYTVNSCHCDTKKNENNSYQGGHILFSRVYLPCMYLCSLDIQREMRTQRTTFGKISGELTLTLNH